MDRERLYEMISVSAKSGRPIPAVISETFFIIPAVFWNLGLKSFFDTLDFVGKMKVCDVSNEFFKNFNVNPYNGCYGFAAKETGDIIQILV